MGLSVRSGKQGGGPTPLLLLLVILKPVQNRTNWYRHVHWPLFGANFFLKMWRRKHNFNFTPLSATFHLVRGFAKCIKDNSFQVPVFSRNSNRQTLKTTSEVSYFSQVLVWSSNLILSCTTLRALVNRRVYNWVRSLWLALESNKDMQIQIISTQWQTR